MALRALVCGFGGTGAFILTYLKEMIVLKEGRLPDSINFLYFDTIADWKPGGEVRTQSGQVERLAGGVDRETSLDPNSEYFQLKDTGYPTLNQYVTEILTDKTGLEQHPQFKDWLHVQWLQSRLTQDQRNLAEGAAKQRQIGRYAMFKNAQRIIQTIQTKLDGLAQNAGGSPVAVWLIGSSAGGTGAGCLMDATIMVRMVGDKLHQTRGSTIVLNGVVVLPDVYTDITGVTWARGYSIFREFERMQFPDLQPIDKWQKLNTPGDITLEVLYDTPSNTAMTATVKTSLFDSLFYMGKTCNNDLERENFFASVANAIDPYLDERSGPDVRARVVNTSSVFGSMWGSRIYLPKGTLSDIYTWEQVNEFFQAASARRVGEDGVVGYHAGAPDDRSRQANETIEGFMILFEELAKYRGLSKEGREAVATQFDPKEIVEKWYQFSGDVATGMALSTDEKADILLTIINPYISLEETDIKRVEEKDIRLKTYKERKKAGEKGVKKDSSLEEFRKRLQLITTEYKEGSGNNSFEKGRQLVRKKVGSWLRNKVDQFFLQGLNNQRVAVDPGNPEEGTSLTRLLEEAKNAVSDEGVLLQIKGTIGDLVSGLEKEQSRQDSFYNEAVRSLEGAKPRKADLLQKSARSDCYEYIHWYQKLNLMRDMADLVDEVIQRYQAWYKVLSQMMNSLILDMRNSSFNATSATISKLERRLHKLSMNKSAMIWLGDPAKVDAWADLEEMEGIPETRRDYMTLHGYRDILKQRAVTQDQGTLVDAVFPNATWEVKPGVEPGLQLKVSIPGGDFSFSPRDIENGKAAEALQKHFKIQIDNRLHGVGVFDYLLFLNNTRGEAPEIVAQTLVERAESLLDTQETAQCMLVYADPADDDRNVLAAKQAYLNSLSNQLNSLTQGANFQNPIDTHNDQNSLSLVYWVSPNLAAVNNLTQCRNHYEQMQSKVKTGNNQEDELLYDAQVYHPFRPELEAWYIERKWAQKRNQIVNVLEDHLVPRVTRLLEDPAMIHAFCKCVAVGAVEKQSNGSWIWHNTVKGREVILADSQDYASPDVIAAGVTFVLQKRERKSGSAVFITLKDALQSAVDKAKEKGGTLDEVVSKWVEQELDRFLGESYNPLDLEGERGRKSLDKIFRFYCDPDTRTTLVDRFQP